MKYSVLLPTRNGGLFLKNCIQSILDQDYEDMELVISDNANNDSTAEIISEFAGHPCVKAFRSDKPVSVTDNWNNALLASTGDYFLMMGDDDYLLPNYFHRIDRILKEYNQPDCVLHNAYSYVAPGSISNNQSSFYSESHFEFEDGLGRECRLTQEQCFDIVSDMFNFKVRIPLNMQTTLVSRKAFNLVNGGLFRPPFPDHYALNSLLLATSNWVFSPEKLLIVGVSPKSFGHFVYSNNQASGLSYLGISADFEGRLPGNELLNGMYIWLKLLKKNYSTTLKYVAINRAGYVRRQLYAWFMQLKLHAIKPQDLFYNLSLFSFSDWLGLTLTIFDLDSWKRLLKITVLDSKKSSAESQWHSLQPIEGITDIRQFSEWLNRKNSAN